MLRNIHTGEIFEVVAKDESPTQSGERTCLWRLRAVADGYETRWGEDELWAHFDEYYPKAPLDHEVADSIREMSMWWGRRPYR